jgi:hypothetical protein
MSKTLITWPPGSADGEREAKRLQALYPSRSNWVDGSDLGSVNSADFKMLIVVGHREEIQAIEVLKSLAACSAKVGAQYIIMANCNSGQTQKGGTLSDANELWSPAQRLANETGARVAATTRELLFTEVGQGTAFQASVEHGITTKEPNTGATLWRYLSKQDPVDEITEGLSNL